MDSRHKSHTALRTPEDGAFVTDIENSLDNNQAGNFTQWIRECVINSMPLTKKQKYLGLLDTTLGGLGSAVAFPLGYEFGNILCKKFNISDPAVNETIKLYFALTATASTAILLAKIANSVLAELVAPVNPAKRELTSTEFGIKKCVDYSLITILWISAAVSASPETYLSYNYFNEPLGYASIIFMLSIFECLMTKNAWAFQNLFLSIYKELKFNWFNKLTGKEKTAVNEVRYQLHNQLEKNVHFVVSLNNAEVNKLASIIYSPDTQINTKIEAIFSPETAIMNHDVELYVDKIKKRFGYFGGMIGVIGTAALFELGTRGGDAMSDLFNIKEQTARTIIRQLFGIGAFVFRSSLAIFTSNTNFQNLYSTLSTVPKKINLTCVPRKQNMLIEKPEHAENSNLRTFCKMMSYFAGTVIAISGGTPRIAMTNDVIDDKAWYYYPLIICAYIAAFNQNFWAINGLLDNYFSPPDKRKKIVSAIDKVDKLLAEMPDKKIYAIYNNSNLLLPLKKNNKRSNDSKSMNERRSNSLSMN